MFNIEPVSSNTILDQSLLKDFKSFFFNGKQCISGFEISYNAAYHFWKKTMFFALQNESKIKEPETLHSDDFLRNEISCLFYKDLPVGIFMFDWFDLSFSAHRDHSYFQNYPVSVLQQLQQDSHFKIMTMSNLTVDPKWRKSQVGYGVSEILLGLATKRFLASTATALIIYTRNDRNTHKLTYRHGGIPLLKDHISHGVSSDIIVVYRDSIEQTSIPDIGKWVEQIWDTRVNLI